MSRLFALLVLVALSSADAAPRFIVLDVFIESDEPLAAWQFELRDRVNALTVVGIENGESAAFDRAPYYDRDATKNGDSDRIVVADYSLANESKLPRGRVRVASLHLMVDDATPDFDLKLITASTRDGRTISASASLDMK